jgi:hypothetical protein
MIINLKLTLLPGQSITQTPACNNQNLLWIILRVKYIRE